MQQVNRITSDNTQKKLFVRECYLNCPNIKQIGRANVEYFTSKHVTVFTSESEIGGEVLNIRVLCFVLIITLDVKKV